jgi:predicted acylesterase/phospholipase RssA
LSLNITLKEFYEYSKIEFHLYTFEINKFETVDLSYKTHPDLSLMQAIFMSSALPGVFMPICIDNDCYMDGGVLANYPISYCLKDHNNPDETLGVTFCRDATKSDTYQNNVVTDDSSVIDYTIGFFMNAINYIYKNIKKDKILNQIECYNEDYFVTVESIQKSINDSSMRKKWIDKGLQDAKIFLEKIKNIDIESKNDDHGKNNDVSEIIEQCVRTAPSSP